MCQLMYIYWHSNQHLLTILFLSSSVLFVMFLLASDEPGDNLYCGRHNLPRTGVHTAIPERVSTVTGTDPYLPSQEYQLHILCILYAYRRRNWMKYLNFVDQFVD